MFVAVFPPSPPPSLTRALIEAGYRPVPVEDVGEVGAKAPETGWRAAVVHVGADPAFDLMVARKIREEHELPVLVVVDRLAIDVIGDRDEFDDFALTPIDPAELRLRMRRLGSSPAEAGEDPVLRFEDLELNTSTYQASVGGRPVDLTYMEYELLRFFVEHPRKVWSREQILARVWGYDYFGGSRTVDVHVRRLRAKLGESRASWITTVRSVGYRFG